MDTPPDCMDIIKLLRGNAEERKEGVRLLFELPFIRYYTVYWYGRYLPRIKIKYPVWNDLYLDTIFEIVNEVEEGRGPRTNCKGYVSRLCQNLCEKAIREAKEDETLDNVLASLLSDDPRSRLWEWVNSILKKMECKCEQKYQDLSHSFSCISTKNLRTRTSR